MRISYIPLLLHKRFQLNEELRKLTLHDVIGRHFVARKRDTNAEKLRRAVGAAVTSDQGGTIQSADTLTDADSKFIPRYEASAAATSSGKQFLQQILSCLITNTCKGE